ncbi:LysR substrate-binding domain-containing protein [Aliikangiella maris]|uniref:LysR substrate-binding domain-containing protein n=2 Tax=Aliikangiella maris TaxID=3162458 RepID=A0ABV3MQK2_9GAMM
MRKLPPLNSLKAFEAVARLSSITEAANELYVSHSSISQHIRQLESYFDQKLFIREGRGLRPTEQAKVYLKYVRSCFDQLAVASELLAYRGNRKIISVNATPSFALRWFIPRSSEFQINHPNIELRVSVSNNDGVAHLNEPFDVIFRREPIRLTDYQSFLLFADQSTPVMSPTLYDSLRPESVEDLLKGNLMHMRSRPQLWHDWFNRFAKKIDNNKVNFGPFYDHFFLSLQAAISGHGIAIGPYALIEDDLKSKQLVAPFPDKVVDNHGFHVAIREELLTHRLSYEFLQWLNQFSHSQVV